MDADKRYEPGALVQAHVDDLVRHVETASGAVKVGDELRLFLCQAAPEAWHCAQEGRVEELRPEQLDAAEAARGALWVVHAQEPIRAERVEVAELCSTRAKSINTRATHGRLGVLIVTTVCGEDRAAPGAGAEDVGAL